MTRPMRVVRCMRMCRQDTLTSLFLRSMRCGGGGEACLGARGLGLLSLTIGAGDSSERCAMPSCPCRKQG